MAFKNGLSERLDELRFPSPRSPPSETPFPGYSSLSPGHSTFVSSFPRPSGDVRAHLQRRFTTDASKLSSWNYINQVGPAPQAPDALDLLSSVSSVATPDCIEYPILRTPQIPRNALCFIYPSMYSSLFPASSISLTRSYCFFNLFIIALLKPDCFSVLL
jgi:hypothetical protein